MSEDSFGFVEHVHRYFDQFEVPFKLAFNEDELRVLMPRDGIVLIHASWSGYSIRNMFRILKTIKDRGERYSEVVIVDIDGLTPETSLSLIGRPAQGYAEGALTRDGQVVSVHAFSHQFEGFLAALKG